jgi:hypothetical protein
LDIPAKEAISKDFSMGVDIVSTPAKNRDRRIGNPGLLRGYFSAGLLGAENCTLSWSPAAEYSGEITND